MNMLLLDKLNILCIIYIQVFITKKVNAFKLIMLLSRRFSHGVSAIFMGILGAGVSYYAFYPQIQERKLLKLMEALDREGRYDEMHEIAKSPYLQHHEFIFKASLPVQEPAKDIKESKA